MKLLITTILFGVLVATVRGGLSSLPTSSRRSLDESDLEEAEAPEASEAGEAPEKPEKEFPKSIISFFLNKRGFQSKLIKEFLLSLISSRCELCDENQKEMIRKGIEKIKKEDPKVWEEFKNKYDPDGSLLDYTESFVKNS